MAAKFVESHAGFFNVNIMLFASSIAFKHGIVFLIMYIIKYYAAVFMTTPMLIVPELPPFTVALFLAVQLLSPVHHALVGD